MAENNTTDIIANTKKKIAYLQTLMTLGNSMTNISTILKGFLATSSIATVIQRYKELEWSNIVFIILFTILIMCVDMYYLQMSRWYRNIYNEVTKLREDSSYFAWEFLNKFNFSTNVYNYQKIKPKYFKSFTSKSIFLFYIPLILIDITIGCFNDISKSNFVFNKNLIIELILVLIAYITFIIAFIYSTLKEHYKRTKDKKEIWENDKNNTENIESNEKKEIPIISPENALEVEFSWKDKNNKSPIDCDVSVIICDENKKVLFKNRKDYLKNLVCFASPYFGKEAIEHCGDNPTESKDESAEKIIIKLNAIPKNVYNLFFIINIYDGKDKQNFSKLEKAEIELNDLTTGQTLSKCDLITGFDVKKLKENTGFEAAVLTKEDNKWCFRSTREFFKDADRLETIINNRYL